MTDNDEPPAGPDRHINFDAPAVLRNWPSLNNQRRTESTGPYLLLDGTLDECIPEFMAKPAPVRHLYSIRCLSAQVPRALRRLGNGFQGGTSDGSLTPRTATDR